MLHRKKTLAERCLCENERNNCSSPDLPNARVSDATPKRPLLAHQDNSTDTRYTSTQSSELGGLREIFKRTEHDHEKLNGNTRKGLVKKTSSLAKIKSIPNLVKRRLSKDCPRPKSNLRSECTLFEDDGNDVELGTVVKTPREGPNPHVQITKENLRNDLLSDKPPEEGGYDSDAEALEEIAMQIGKRSASKRPSVHSIEWTSSTGSRHALMTTAERANAMIDNHSYPIETCLESGEESASAQPALHSDSNPDITVKSVQPQKQSPSVMEISHPTAEKLDSAQTATVDAAESLEDLSEVEGHFIPQFLQSLSGFSVVSQEDSSDVAQVETLLESEGKQEKNASSQSEGAELSKSRTEAASVILSSSSIMSGNHKENVAVFHSREVDDQSENDDEDNPRRSVHLYNMRISHHLRSGSLLSYDQRRESSPPISSLELASVGFNRLDRPPVDLNLDLNDGANSQTTTRHARQTSSSGFSSSKIPTRWGSVVQSTANYDFASEIEDGSSVYSSRPQSAPDSMNSMAHLPGILDHLSAGRFPMRVPGSSINDNPHSAFASDETDHEETPKAFNRYTILQNQNSKDQQCKPEAQALIGRGGDGRQSKFIEHFSTEQPKRKLVSSKSMMRFLFPHSHTRDSMRSYSDSGFSDGPADDPEAFRSRRLSRSLISLRAENQAMQQHREPSTSMWERALKSSQEERSTMFLSPNRAFAAQATPFRERSSSISVSRPHSAATTPGTNEMTEWPNSCGLSPGWSPRLSTAPSPGPSPDTSPSPSRAPSPKPPPKRRIAIAGEGDQEDPMTEVRHAFFAQSESVAAVGAWGRYPSHSRGERTASAGPQDHVQTRDFALEAGIQFATQAEVDPTERLEAPLRAQSRLKRVSSVIINSPSLTFGKQLIKSYTRMFRSQSTEFQRHGHGHRSSIAVGGSLEYPELELLPEVFTAGANINDEEEDLRGTWQRDGANERANTKSETKTRGSRNRSYSSLPQVDTSQLMDGTSEIKTSFDRARAWSRYYEDCVAPSPFGSISSRNKRSASIHRNDIPELGRSRSMETKWLARREENILKETATSLPMRLKLGHEQSKSVMSEISEVPSGFSGRVAIDM
ncbi:hypothetical protein GQ43DRAFT_478008 [Delitschia confertaspora ATCC 74209]|uniref:Uncharacterized protein n=1 Tax=Delitschia confertaspora ATCC 74209 TaxID=1513339 RepID=A0A9P4JYA7_9PLEO|nr:hypothetical protein GQ43DRAFT_478008 [Delitschia confertaspora ATCC 74209]